jgi:hypothetical protein
MDALTPVFCFDQDAIAYFKTEFVKESPIIFALVRTCFVFRKGGADEDKANKIKGLHVSTSLRELRQERSRLRWGWAEPLFGTRHTVRSSHFRNLAS